jgi:hypothetical protein
MLTLIKNIVGVFLWVGVFTGCGMQTSLSYGFPENAPTDSSDSGAADEPTTEPVSEGGGDVDNPGSENPEAGTVSASSSGAFVTAANGGVLQSESYSLVVMLGSPVVPRDDDLSESLGHEIFPWLN